MQQLLDTVFERASDSARARFGQLVGAPVPVPPPAGDATAGYALTVAIAIVTNGSDVLLVQTRRDDGISWQFPAGMVKPGVSPELVAVRETLAETGVHCRVTRDLGTRLHPITNVRCDYLLCDYLTGDPQNLDPVENVSVAWASISHLTRFIPLEQIFQPIVDALRTLDEPREP